MIPNGSTKRVGDLTSGELIILMMADARVRAISVVDARSQEGNVSLILLDSTNPDGSAFDLFAADSYFNDELAISLGMDFDFYWPAETARVEARTKTPGTLRVFGDAASLVVRLPPTQRRFGNTLTFGISDWRPIPDDVGTVLAVLDWEIRLKGFDEPFFRAGSGGPIARK
jgi:hypothetical protein